jgi:hypothetical protein
VVTQRNGTRGQAEEIPGVEALSPGADFDGATSASCASAGDCAGGLKLAPSGGSTAFLVTERNGTWGPARTAPGLAALDAGHASNVASVWCASAGNCAAGGWYRTSTTKLRQQAWVASEHNGRWAKATKVPGSALNRGAYAQVDTVSCGAPGNCAAGAFYTPAGRPFYSPRRAFVVSEHNGTWDQMQPVPGLAALDRGRYSALNSVACSSSGRCSAVGTCSHANGVYQMFVADRS